ncbi:ligand-binding protein SH3 [Paraburkholderia unamae]|uniref:Small multidrug resistance pump n=1 Tax=Paraburkholderia unamae TaxID=219649 RepID=A0ABX5KKP1_9BURK|nr:ligand-binding protein SH3 [Paraburkholderia unamae]PVX82322.1 small multidrug resistance pump [Paraburkholderia unamae]RAR60646.1 small multidrug resistance pump [Paraburkholderia unamae]CAG9255662.1 Small multidrug resistance pump [Paraburkholderia unamae]
MYIIFVLLSGTFSAVASILLRIAARSPENFSRLTVALLDRPMQLRLGAICAYGFGFVCYAISLKKIELSIAYPLMVGITILEIFVYGLLNNEVATARSMTGAAFLIVAMFLLYSRDMTRG